jgi:hypothetical protein
MHGSAKHGDFSIHLLLNTCDASQNSFYFRRVATKNFRVFFILAQAPKFIYMSLWQVFRNFLAEYGCRVQPND